MAIQVTYRRTRRLSMRIVKNGDVHVLAPPSCFSGYLLLLPDWCAEHVVVHELCHLLEPSHNARFHALMDRYFPRWREARKETHRICRMEGEEEVDVCDAT